MWVVASFSPGRTPRSQTSPSMCTRACVRRAATTWRASRRCRPGWSGSPLCRGMCRRPLRGVQGQLLIESTASWRLAEITLSLAQAERFAWALGTRLSGMLAEVEREVKTSGDRQSAVVEDSDVAALRVDDC